MIRFALTVLLLATPASAAEITRVSQGEGYVITIRGEIAPGDSQKFGQHVLYPAKVHVVVVLDSIGGHIGAAIAIARVVRWMRYDTKVHNHAQCNSSCPLIWFAGKHRDLGHVAKLGLHSASTWEPPYERYEPGNTAIAAFLTELDIPHPVIALQPKADPCCLNYIDHEQANAWGLLSARPAKLDQQAVR